MNDRLVHTAEQCHHIGRRRLRRECAFERLTDRIGDARWHHDHIASSIVAGQGVSLGHDDNNGHVVLLFRHEHRG